jgi:MFS transporter, ACS family, tartrate transporter
VISAGMMFVRTPAQFCVLRFLLGAAEAGFFPGVIYYLSLWYPQTQCARAIAAFMTAVPVTGLLGGPLSGFLLGLSGAYRLAGWQWLFLVEGLPAVILGTVALFYLPEDPQVARWLTTAERDLLLAELAREGAAVAKAKRIGIFAALTNGIVWQLGIIFLLAAIAFYGYSFWSPLVIKSLSGASDLGVGFVSGAISAATILFMLLNSAHSDRTDERPCHVALALLIMAIGCFGCAMLRTPLLGILSLALVPIGHCSAYGPFWSIPSRFLRGAPAAAGTALVVTIANVGGFVGPSLMGYLKQRSGTHTLAFLFLGIFGLLAALLAYTLRRFPALTARDKIMAVA